MANTHSADLESGSSQYFSITDASQTGLDFSGDFTIEFWVKIESVGSKAQYFTMKGNSGSGGTWYGVLMDTDRSVTLAVDNGSSNTTVNAPAGTMPVGVWTHVAVKRDSTTGYVLINGLQVATDTVHNNSMATSDPLIIGGRWSGGAISIGSNSRFVDGLMNDVRYWSDVRTDAEIQDNIGADTLASEAGLVGRYKFNNNAEDSSSNGNDLTANNSPTYTTDIPYTGTLVDISTDGTLATDLVSAWLTDSSGLTTDLHSSNTLTNDGVSLTTGKQGDAGDFEASQTDELNIADGSQTGLDFTGDMSWAFWIKPETLFTTSAGIINKWVNAGNNRAYQFYFDNSTNDRFGVYLSPNGTSGAQTISTVDLGEDLSTGTDYHVVMTYDASAGVISAYLNGVLKGVATGAATSIYNSGAEFAIGKSGQGSFDGIINQVLPYSRILTAGEVSNLYNGGDGLPYLAAATFVPTMQII